jgi:phenylalanyl-tRNA synthetase beta chain
MLRLAEDAPERNAIRILNPISEDLSLMRTTLTPSMLNAAVRNMRRGNMKGRFFEIASIYTAETLPLNAYPTESRRLCIGAFGDGETFFTVKGALEVLCETFGMTFTYEKAEKPFTHPGMTAKITMDGHEIGYIGRLAHDLAAELAIEKPVILCELDYEAIAPKLLSEMQYKPVSKFPTETRDLALVMDEAVTCAEVSEAILSSCKYLTSVELFDVYRSEQIGAGKKSMAFKLTFTPDDHAFTGEELDKFVAKTLKKLEFTMHIVLR